MEAGGPKPSSSPLPVIGLLLLVIGAFYISRSPLESSRPEVSTKPGYAKSEEGKIEARLWQDPFRVALDHEMNEHGAAQPTDSNSAWVCRSNHCVNEIAVQMDRILDKETYKPDKPVVQVLLTIVRDGTFAEDHERRLRNRYAMLTALATSGLASEDSKHIEYFKLMWIAENELESNIENNIVPQIGSVSDKSKVMVVPFEWFERAEPYPNSDSSERVNDYIEHVLVIWLPESAFSHKPLTRLAQVIDAIDYKTNCKVRIDVIGPSYSGTLAAMINELGSIDSNNTHPVNVNSMLKDLTIFSPWSTASPALLVKDIDDAELDDKDRFGGLYDLIPRRFDKKNIKFVRIAGSDDLLAMALINELRRRGVDPTKKKDYIALVSEWDTLYGQAFPLTFAAMMENIDPNGNPCWPEYIKNLCRETNNVNQGSRQNLSWYSYIRGVDGKLPQNESVKEKGGEGQQETESKWTYSKNLELPLGRGQLDYVRRLAQEIDVGHPEKYRSPNYGRLKAIGVVGSDVYDKLILLHAMREQFSGLILFTTDLDARLMNNEQFRWTRNVVVASNYGLKLADDYQKAVYQHEKRRKMSPFRDNYQTALFFACRVALGLHLVEEDYDNSTRAILRNDYKKIQKLIINPRVFEIGRGTSVDLSVPTDNDKNKEQRAYIQIHPEPQNRFPGWWIFVRNLSLILAVVLICVYLLVHSSLTLHKKVLSLLASLGSALSMLIAVGKGLPGPANQKAKTEEQKSEEKNNHLVIISIIVVIAFIAVIIIDHYRTGGERFSLVTGTSVWPGSALRLLAIILCAFLLTKAARNLHAADMKLCKWFDPQKPDELISSAISYSKWRESENLSGCYKLSFHPYTWFRYRRRIGISNWTIDEKRAEAGQLWKEYLDRGTVENRVHRLILPTLFFWILIIILYWYFGRPNIPYRGSVSSLVDAVLASICVFLMIIFMFFIVDATRLCLRPIHAMIEFPNWHEGLIDGSKIDSMITLPDIENWLDVQFIAQLTDSVGKLIYYPFIIIAIMIAVRWQYFDNWDWPISLMTVYMTGSFYIISCVVRLQYAAKKARKQAISKLQKTQDRIRFVDSKRSEQIEYLIGRIKSVKQGAFTPFFENPVVHVLIPSGGMSLLALLRFLPQF